MIKLSARRGIGSNVNGVLRLMGGGHSLGSCTCGLIDGAIAEFYNAIVPGFIPLIDKSIFAPSLSVLKNNHGLHSKQSDTLILLLI